MKNTFDNPHFKPTKKFLDTVKKEEDKMQFFLENPDVLVRKYAIDEDIDFLLSRSLYQQLESQYGIKVVPHELVLGKDHEGKKAMFIVTKRVKGNDLSKLETLPDSAILELNNTIHGLWNFLKNTYQTKRPFLNDIYKDTSYVYGTLPGEDKSGLFLVDLDPYVTAFDGKNLDLDEYLQDVEQLMNFIEEVEDLNENIKLLPLYKEIKLFYNNLNSNSNQISK